MSVLRSRFRFRIRHPWRIVIVGLILAAVGVEAARLITTQAMIDQAAREAARYAVTGIFNAAHCSDYDPIMQQGCDTHGLLPREQRAPMEDAARLQTIYDIARQALGGWSSGDFKIVVCSTRKGYAYDAAKSLCLPHDDPGQGGDHVLVHITYNYEIGSLIGVNVGRISLQSTREMIVERIGSPRIPGLPPTPRASIAP
jgi:hypothetical protein